MGFAASRFGSTPFGSTQERVLAEFWVGNWQPFIGDYVPRLSIVQFDVHDYDVENRTHVATNLQVRTVQGAVVETVWSLISGFSSRYYRGSSRKPLAAGGHFTLRRTGGWITGDVRVDVVATDLAGNQVRRQSRLP